MKPSLCAKAPSTSSWSRIPTYTLEDARPERAAVARQLQPDAAEAERCHGHAEGAHRDEEGRGNGLAPAPPQAPADLYVPRSTPERAHGCHTDALGAAEEIEAHQRVLDGAPIERRAPGGTPLAREGAPLVCFAGEATSADNIGTVGGAMTSGVREARRLLEAWGLETEGASIERLVHSVSQHAVVPDVT